MIKVARLLGTDLAEALDAVAKLRIEVFRDFPYLYDGDEKYERAYLQVYRESEAAIVVGAFDEEQLVGASTGMPMADHADDFGAAFEGQDVDIKDIFYCAESVLLPQYRGHGIGHRFFDLREAHGRALGLGHVAFCSVMRPGDHPLKPKQYQPLDPFWRKRGYAPVKGAVAHFGWKDIDQPNETDHPLQFWMRRL